MSHSLSKEEKMVLIAVMKYIVSTDGVITDREIDDINNLAEEKGFEDFQKTFNEVDRTIKSIDDLKKHINNVTDEKARMNILKYALEFSEADAEINPHENEILQYMSKQWHINIKSLL
jgi:uncharacterized tellurite resistance protein B-like protein